jgi:hypothetical protein
MSDPTVRGVVHAIEDTKTYGQKGFRKRVVVLEQDKGRFINYIPLEFVQDGCDSVDELTVGTEIEATYRLNGRKWQRDEQSEVKYFLNAEATGFKILQAGGGGGGGSAAPEYSDSFEPAQPETFSETDDDVPF